MGLQLEVFQPHPDEAIAKAKEFGIDDVQAVQQHLFIQNIKTLTDVAETELVYNLWLQYKTGKWFVFAKKWFDDTAVDFWDYVDLFFDESEYDKSRNYHDAVVFLASWVNINHPDELYEVFTTRSWRSIRRATQMFKSVHKGHYDEPDEQREYIWEQLKTLPNSDFFRYVEKKNPEKKNPLKQPEDLPDIIIGESTSNSVKESVEPSSKSPVVYRGNGVLPREIPKPNVKQVGEKVEITFVLSAPEYERLDDLLHPFYQDV